MRVGGFIHVRSATGLRALLYQDVAQQRTNSQRSECFGTHRINSRGSDWGVDFCLIGSTLSRARLFRGGDCLQYFERRFSNGRIVICSGDGLQYHPYTAVRLHRFQHLQSLTANRLTWIMH